MQTTLCKFATPHGLNNEQLAWLFLTDEQKHLCKSVILEGLFNGVGLDSSVVAEGLDDIYAAPDSVVKITCPHTRAYTVFRPPAHNTPLERRTDIDWTTERKEQAARLSQYVAGVERARFEASVIAWAVRRAHAFGSAATAKLFFPGIVSLLRQAHLPSEASKIQGAGVPRDIPTLPPNERALFKRASKALSKYELLKDAEPEGANQCVIFVGATNDFGYNGIKIERL